MSTVEEGRTTSPTSASQATAPESALSAPESKPSESHLQQEANGIDHPDAIATLDGAEAAGGQADTAASRIPQDAPAAHPSVTTPPTTTTSAASAAASATVAHNPFEDTENVHEEYEEPTPALPPRPEETHATMATTAAPPAPASAPAVPPPTNDVPPNVQEEHVNPQVEALRSMFPDFDVAVLQSVLESVNNDQERALDILLGMSDPEYVSTTQAATEPQQLSSTELDEALARQLMLEDHEQQRQQRHATGAAWPHRNEGQVPYQARQYHPDANRVPPPEDGAGRSDFQDLQRTMGQIAESGKRTFSSIVSKVKAKINEYEQSRTTGGGQGSGSAPAPQWGAAPPTNLDRHTASQAYQQQYFAPAQPQPQLSSNAEPNLISLHDSTDVQGYNVDAPAVHSPPASQSPPAASSMPAPGVSGISPAASPRPSSDVPRPPPTSSGSPVNAAKIGLLPKRPVSLMNTSSPPPTRPSDDDELEYVENPFEEHK